MRQNIAALICGILFGTGLTLSQMSNPDKVLAFLDVAGDWDVSLMLVMIGAVGTLGIAQHFILKRQKPVWSRQFHLPKTAGVIDTRLILGATIFGVGWGLVGFCPGAVLAALSDGKREPLIFTIALGVGMMLFHRFHNKK